MDALHIEGISISLVMFSFGHITTVKSELYRKKIGITSK
jgi:hypothetical protein